MINSRFAVAIHILSLIAANPGKSVTSDYIAGSVNTNPVVIRRISSMLKKAGLLQARAGVAGAVLAKEIADISLLDVYRAVQAQDELFAIHESPNPNCPIGRNIQSTLEEAFLDAQKAMENELASKSVADIVHHLSP
ncbi:BadM/Rrf2 family transcriptional regulator [Aneurinibacillus soli]|uniref:Putative HTH-type transcriptional regulator YwnA n=1 Tax=Aneurinibacillus soli TaxID=1500254 RepID=A0A0U5CAX4_9BACL|nr:Rrf2 family transcriptional regulator [Aneurinibacillus soli]PYE58045.1 BadM/Rrf2 family transcriptional regulator [Aneurinibacillus soli]BAU29923.1 putative HTH-type transcriptional regulator YwnA [Aneurinibacillus soli]